MSQEIEIEFKNGVNEIEFHRLMDAFHVQPEDFVLQHNHYLDTPQFELKESGCALRIREKNERFELTLKEPADEGLLETNETLTRSQADALLKKSIFPEGNVKNAVQSLITDFKALKHFGTLSTKRAEVPFKGGTLVFDHSFYLNKQDYEIEYEVTDRKKGEEIFYNLLNTYQIPAKPTDNKVKRFYMEKMRQSSGDE